MKFIIAFLALTASSYAAELERIDLSHYGTSLFKSPSLETGKLVANYTPGDKGNPEELGQDMFLPKPKAGNGLIMSKYPTYKWPNGKVPYVIEGTYTTAEKALLLKAFDTYKTQTCIQFYPRTNEANYIAIQSAATGCWSYIGMNGGKQFVNLQSNGCLYSIGTPLHELMHALGFDHEQNRPDRDSYVSINMTNVAAGKGHNFNIDSADKFTTFGLGYDFNSTMHYSAYAFASNSKFPTIVPKVVIPKGVTMGQRNGFSPQDIRQIKIMYCGGK